MRIRIKIVRAATKGKNYQKKVGLKRDVVKQLQNTLGNKGGINYEKIYKSEVENLIKVMDEGEMARKIPTRSPLPMPQVPQIPISISDKDVPKVIGKAILKSSVSSAVIGSVLQTMSVSSTVAGASVFIGTMVSATVLPIIGPVVVVGGAISLLSDFLIGDRGEKEQHEPGAYLFRLKIE